MKNNTEHKVVNYFVQHKTGDIWIQPYYASAVTHRQMRQSAELFWISMYCFFATILSSILLYRYQTIHTILGYLFLISAAGMIVFGLRAASKFLKQFEHKDDSTARSLLESMDSFKKLFGRFPGQLGRRSVAKKLVKQVKKILVLETKKRDTYRAHEHLRKMYDTAKMLVPVNRYEELFAAAKANEIPAYIPSPED